MRFGHLRSGIAAFVVTLVAASAQAQDARVQQLERALQERDKVIIELLERVEALERRVGVQRSSGRTEARRQDMAPSTESAERAPGSVVAEEGSAERALDRVLTLDGALLLPSGVLEAEPALVYARREDAAPRFVTAGGSVFIGETRRNENSVGADLALRLGLPWDAQLEIGVPYQWRQVESVASVGFVPTESATRTGNGLGDVRVGLAKTLLREGLRRPDLVGRITWDTATGETLDNGVSLGGGFHELRGSLTATKRQDPVAFVGSLSYQYAFEKGGIQPGPTFSASLGSLVALSPETALRFLFAGSYQGETKLSGREIVGSDRVIGSFVVGGSTLLARGTLLNLSVGIGLTEDADDFSILLSLPIRFGKALY